MNPFKDCLLSCNHILIYLLLFTSFFINGSIQFSLFCTVCFLFNRIAWRIFYISTFKPVPPLFFYNGCVEFMCHDLFSFCYGTFKLFLAFYYHNNPANKILVYISFYIFEIIWGTDSSKWEFLRQSLYKLKILIIIKIVLLRGQANLISTIIPNFNIVCFI